MSDMRTPNGVYNTSSPWFTNQEGQNGANGVPSIPRHQYLGPFASNEQRLTQQAIQVGLLPADEVADMVQVPLPQVQLFPPRYGYETRTIGIMDIMDLDKPDLAKNRNNPRVSWFSGGVAGYSGASRNSLGQV